MNGTSRQTHVQAASSNHYSPDVTPTSGNTQTRGFFSVRRPRGTIIKDPLRKYPTLPFPSVSSQCGRLFEKHKRAEPQKEKVQEGATLSLPIHSSNMIGRKIRKGEPIGISNSRVTTGTTDKHVDPGESRQKRRRKVHLSSFRQRESEGTLELEKREVQQVEVK